MSENGLNKDFTALRGFIKFLKEEKFDIASSTYFTLIKEADLPLLSFYVHLSSHDLQKEVADNLSEFLDELLEGSFLHKFSDKISEWKSDSHTHIPREKINIADIILLNSVRKQVLLTFLSDFSSKSNEATAVMIAIERLLMATEKKAVEAYSEIQEEAIAERREFFSKLIENSINGVWVVDTQGNILEWNPVMAKELNISRSNAIGKNIFKVIPNFGQSHLGVALKGVLQNGVRVMTRDNQFPLRRGWYDSFITPLYNQKGDVKMILCILHDITTRKEIEERLQEHKEELQAANEELLEQQEELRHAYMDLQNNNKQLIATKDALKAHEARLLEAQAIAHLGSWEYDIENDKIFWSDEMKKIFGYAVDEFLDYETYLRLLHPEDVEFINETIERTLRTHEPYTFEHRIIRKDGTVRYIVANGRAVLSEEHEIIKLQGTGLDITDLKMAELEKKDNQHFIQKINETTPDLITVYDLQLKKNIYSNRALYEFLGYSPSEVKLIRKKKAEGFKEILHPDDHTKVQDLFYYFMSYFGNETKEIEYRFKKKNGDWLWVWSRYKVFKRSATGLPTQLIGISRDITKRKNTEGKILENEMRLKDSQLLAKLGYWELDLASENVFWSDELFRIYDIPKKPSLKLSEIKKQLFPEDQEILEETLRNAIATGESYQLQYRLLLKGKELRYINTKGEAIKNEEGKVTKIRGIVQDITERKIIAQKLETAYDELKETHEELKRSEESLRQLNNELETRVLNRTEALQESNERLVKINADLDNFIYTASHDLKVPIANIEGLLNILKKKVDNHLKDNDKIIIHMMEESVCRFNATIKDLTQISKIQKDLEEENSETILFSETLDSLLPDMAGLIAEKNSKICTHFEVDEIIFAKKNLRSILYNLIVNSLKYSSDERLPQITISTKRDPEGIVLSIADNGMGVPEKQLVKIFSLFKRYHTNIEGSGIGLYIVKRIVENRGGRIDVKSEVNVGTTFNIIFPNKD